jgi:membrane fusion protein, multidrug efflux system
MEEKSDFQHRGPGPRPSSSRPWFHHPGLIGTGLVAVVALLIFTFIGTRKNSAQTTSSSSSSRSRGGRNGRAGAGGPVTLTVSSATKGNIGMYVEAIGTVTPVYTSTITAQASGVLNQVRYREGQLVRQGDPLIEIDPRPYEAQVLEAQGALDRDNGILAQAQMDLDRYRTAWAKNSINKQLLDDQEKIVLQDEGTVKNDQGVLDYDKVELSYCHIAAPIAGRVGLRLVDPGNVVQASGTTPLVVITQVQPITVIFTIAEDNLAQVETRMRKAGSLPVDAMDRAQTEKLASGKLLTIDNLIDTTTGTVKLRALFDNRNNALFPNQFVNTRLLVDTVQGATLIPTNAVQHNGDVAFVYVIASGQAAIRDVKTGVSDSGTVAVTGINPGDVVATSSFDKLQSGSKVVIAKTAPGPANPTEGNAP